MLRTTFKKVESKLYKYFDITAFHTDFQNKLDKSFRVYQNFEETFVRVLDAHPLTKKK